MKHLLTIMSGVTHLYGKCEAKNCCMLPENPCLTFDEGDNGSKSCAFCNCHQSAHCHYGLIVGGVFQSLLPTSTNHPESKKAVGGGLHPVLSQKKMCQAERIAIFRSSMKGKVIDLDSPTKDVATPAKDAQSPSVGREEHLKKRKKVASPLLQPVARSPPKHADYWRHSKLVRDNRAVVLNWTKQGPNSSGLTDIDDPPVFP